MEDQTNYSEVGFDDWEKRYPISDGLIRYAAWRLGEWNNRDKAIDLFREAGEKRSIRFLMPGLRDEERREPIEELLMRWKNNEYTTGKVIGASGEVECRPSLERILKAQKPVRKFTLNFLSGALGDEIKSDFSKKMIVWYAKQYNNLRNEIIERMYGLTVQLVGIIDESKEKDIRHKQSLKRKEVAPDVLFEIGSVGLEHLKKLYERDWDDQIVDVIKRLDPSYDAYTAYMES